MILIILLVIFVITTIFLIMSNMTKSKEILNLERQLQESNDRENKLNNDLKKLKMI